MNHTKWIILALIAGALIPVQTGLNLKLSKAGGSPVHAAMISFVVGAAAIALYLIISRQTVSWDGLKTAPAYAWIGGMLGACFITISIFAFPKLGPALTFSLVVTGQIILSLLLEHFNILVNHPHPINWIRICGFLLVIAGVIIIRKF